MSLVAECEVIKVQDTHTIKSLHCPTCQGPLSKRVLTDPVQCIYCDVWVATCDGRQQKMSVDQQQGIDLLNGIQPDEPIFRENSPLDRLFGRIRRIAPLFVGFPLVWVLMMHLYVGMEWVGPRALPLGDMNAVDMYTFIICVATTITGYSILTALVLFSMSASNLCMLVIVLSQVDDVGSYMESESGIIALFRIGVPAIVAVAWGMMQSPRSMQRYFAKIWAARIRFGLAITLGFIVSFAYFDRPTKRQFINSKREAFTKQTEIFAQLCSIGWSEEEPTTEPILPQPKLELIFLKGSLGNVEAVVCGRAINNNWVSNYLQDEQYEDLNIETNLGKHLNSLHRSYMYDAFLTPKYEASVNAALSATYWLLFDPECTNGAPITAKLYNAKTYTLLRRIKVPCSDDEYGYQDRRRLFESLASETGGVFKVPD